MRKFTFGSFLIGHGSNYCIESVDGLSEPGIVWQEQKAPYQDGATYIDNLFDVREIVIEGSIVASALSTINTAKDTMMRALNPKNGQAWLQYDADGVSKRIMAVGSVVFGNKDYQESFQKFQVTFRCSDPMWQDLAADSINLPTSANSAESVINPAVTANSSVIQKSNGNLFIVYRRVSDNYVVSREYTTSWSAESVVNAAPSNLPVVIQKSNGNLFVVYTRTSDSYLVSREYTTSWSAESVVNSGAIASGPSIIQKSNGNLFIVYMRLSDSYLVSREYTTSWSSESVVNAGGSSFPVVIQKSNGNLFVVYRRSDGYLASKEYTASWGTESVVNAASTFYPSIIQKSNGIIIVAYRRASDNYLVSRDYTTFWGSESIITAYDSAYPCVIQKSNGSLFFSYSRTSDSYLVSVTRSVTPVNAAVTGHIGVSIKVTLNGPSTNPRIINDDTLEYIRLNKTLATGDYFVVNTEFGKKSIELWSGGIKTNGLAYLDLGSTLFQLSPGDNTVYYEDDAVASTATATMEWTERYIGV
jgi:hypothetical protein